MKTRIDTTEYEFSHNETPRGRGRYWFRFTATNGSEVEFSSGQTVTYLEAKKFAREFVAGRFSGSGIGHVVVTVLP